MLSKKTKGFTMSGIPKLLLITVFFSLFALWVINHGGSREYVCKKQSSISEILSASRERTIVRLEDGKEAIFVGRDVNLGAAVCQKFDVYLTPFWSEKAILLDENMTRSYLIR